jgi:hypothetical protein
MSVALARSSAAPVERCLKTTLGGATAQQNCHLVLEFLARHQEPVFGRTLDCVAQCADAARDD